MRLNTRSTNRKRPEKCVPEKRGRGRPRKKTGMDMKLMRIVTKITPRYTLAKNPDDKTQIIKDALSKWIGNQILDNFDDKKRREVHRRVRDAIRDHRKRRDCVESAQENIKSYSIMREMVKWRAGMDDNDVIRDTPKGDVGNANLVRWRIHGNYFNGCTSLNDNLCCITLFPETSRYISSKLEASTLFQKMMELPTARGNKAKGRFERLMNARDFFGDGSTEWVAHGIRSGYNMMSDITFVAPRNKDTFTSLLELLGEAGLDIVMHTIGKRYDKRQLEVTQAYFYIVKNCWDIHKHVDFETGGGNTFNVLIPVCLPETHPQHLVVWDYAAAAEFKKKVPGTEDLSGNYMFKLDEALLVGEDVFHATGISKYKRLMLAICVQNLAYRNEELGFSSRNHGWIHKFAFPNPRTDKAFLKRNRSAHYNKDDTSCCLHRKNTDREIYTFKK